MEGTKDGRGQDSQPDTVKGAEQTHLVVYLTLPASSQTRGRT